MILPYVYKLTHKITGQFYFGYRSANKVPSQLDIGFKYFSSSNSIKELGFENFNIEIIAEFFKVEDALEFEQNLIKENFENDLCLNIQYRLVNGEKKFTTTGYNHSIETKNKISKKMKGKQSPLKGRKLPEETKLKISKSKMGKQSGKDNPMFGVKRPSGGLSPTAKSVLVNGKHYTSIIEAAEDNKYNRSYLCSILKDNDKLNKTIWQAEYYNL